MTPAWAGCLALAALFALLAAWWWATEGAESAVSERSSRPAELAQAELVYIEHSFRISRPLRLVAKLDRAYRLQSGSLVLVELKTRWHDGPHETDIIQLSAQKLAIEAQTGQRVEPFAFVSVLGPAGWRALRHHRVELLVADEVVALNRRRDAVLSGRTAPLYARSRMACSRCAYRLRCDRPQG